MAQVFILLSGEFFPDPLRFRKILFIQYVAHHNSFAFLFFAQKKWLIATTVSLIGIACANVFSILLSHALQTVPAKANSISGLMMMGVAGGAVIPLLMGNNRDRPFTGRNCCRNRSLYALAAPVCCNFPETALMTTYKGRGRSALPLPFFTKSRSMVFL